MFEKLKRNLNELSKTVYDIKADGNYPDRKGTRVQDVAVYQNDGTDNIEPALFVEAAAVKSNNWQRKIFKAVSKFLDGDRLILNIVALDVARDISKACNRIDTGQLKTSFVARKKINNF